MLQEAPQAQDSLCPILPRKCPQCPGTLVRPDGDIPEHESPREPTEAQPEGAGFTEQTKPEKPQASVAYSWWLLELIQEAGLSCRPFREHTPQWSL